MTRLHAITHSVAEIAEQFEVGAVDSLAVPAEIVEGGTAPIVVERDGCRLLKTASWGFPRQISSASWKGETVGRIGLVADLTNPLWDRVAIDPRYRCLVPVSHFANPDGSAGKKTRMWFSSSNGAVLAWAGFVRKSEEFGVVFAGLTMDANELVKPYNDRMPALVWPDEYDRWLRGTISDVIAMQFRPPPPSELFIALPTKDRWGSGIVPRALQAQTSMLM